jgi:hypothetical protein
MFNGTLRKLRDNNCLEGLDACLTEEADVDRKAAVIPQPSAPKKKPVSRKRKAVEEDGNESPSAGRKRGRPAVKKTKIKMEEAEEGEGCPDPMEVQYKVEMLDEDPLGYDLFNMV